MKLSTRGRYGVRLMIDLALNYTDRPVLLKDIAARQNISEKYLWQLISSLSKAGLVRSIRGARGGYFLAKESDSISLKDIISVLEGQLCLANCIEDSDCCNRSNECITKNIWQVVSSKMLETLESITLSDMVKMQKNKKVDGNYILTGGINEHR